MACGKWGVELRVTVGQLIACTLLIGGVGTWWWMPRSSPEIVPPVEGERQQAVAQALVMLVRAIETRECTEQSCEAVDPSYARRVATEARQQLGRPDSRFRDDCSGFVSAVFSAVGVPMDGVVSSIYDLAAVHETIHWSTEPRVGDLVFFDDTHDRNGNGRWDDPLTHIGLIVDVEPDGTAVYAHAGTRRGRLLGRINVREPRRHRDPDGRVLNTYLREPDGDEDPVAAFLSGSLWVGFASVPPELDWSTEAPPPETGP
jgi:hypothetical protein